MKGSLTQRVQVPNNQVLGFGEIGILVQILGRYMVILYLDPKGYMLASPGSWHRVESARTTWTPK